MMNVLRKSNDQNTVNFQRHGVADWLEIRHSKFYVEYHHLTGNLSIYTFNWKRNIVRNYTGEIIKKYWYNHQITVHQQRYDHLATSNPLTVIKDIEAILNHSLGFKNHITIDDRFIEAYYVAAKPFYEYGKNDRPMFKDITVDNLTVSEVNDLVGIDFIEDFQGYKIDKVIHLLNKGTDKLNNMLFTDFYGLIHNNNYKQDYIEVMEKTVI